jgi:hypothetical protein
MRENWHWIALAIVVVAGFVYWKKRQATAVAQPGA